MGNGCKHQGPRRRILLIACRTIFELTACAQAISSSSFRHWVVEAWIGRVDNGADCSDRIGLRSERAFSLAFVAPQPRRFETNWRLILLRHDGNMGFLLKEATLNKHIDPRSLPAEHPFPNCSFDDPGVTREQVWNALLIWAVREAYADGGFVCDQGGLMVAQCGDSSLHQAETASITVKSLALMSKLNTDDSLPTECSFALSDRRLTSFSCTLGGSAQSNGPVLVGVISHHWPAAEVMIDIMTEIRLRVGQESR